ncbi:MAG: hypothetical protein M3R13_06810 [Armatimonadota bacterium]|nr:hypothetical protein [Armatimonadota bacterium]
MRALAIKAHAKINPSLAVGKLRANGYHDIDATFQAIGLHDIVTISMAEESRVRCSNPELNGGANLVTKALRLSSEIFEFRPLDVFIEKRIPMQSGLGGGSSNVAAALRILNLISQGALSPHMGSIAIACGSDVPFFLGSSTHARARCRGEKLEPLLPPEPSPLVIAMPTNVHCSTAEAYARIDALPERSADRPENVPPNDFEAVAPRESLDLIELLRSRGAGIAGLCGSGSAVYGFTPQANQIADGLKAEGLWAAATLTITTFGAPWTP